MSRAQEFSPEDVQIFKEENSRYVYPERARTAVRVALAADRPLLVRGVPGCGKSTLAKNVALTLKWRYREVVVTSRTQARDLGYRFDSLRKLQDAQARELKPDAGYVSPATLWWAFDPSTANSFVPKAEQEQRPGTPCVVLIDEIDKADPDVPNDLLVTLGENRFVVEETREEVKAVKELTPLVILTTNNERSLPQAFVRRCVVLELAPPDLVMVAETHYGAGEAATALYKEVLAKHQEIVTRMKERGLRPPSTAEYLDTVAACRELGRAQLDSIVGLTLEKERPDEDAMA
jgi:MoxR-like ATPase